ncbi:channel-forming protein [Mycolicibacterium conceptionense]|uniref:Channel-forming protein n=2 Tax=Mycolicibacterium TaxID=1866885 RepID=A0A0J8U9K8_9MYCO|nr:MULTISPECIES: copper transporter [Mycolicibacterium]KLI09427.1 channel-forming protein [Mycolicibacterium senegalense]KLO47820.1 channel-forming protein [Mycolicibacterium senegalense]KMV17682.1 channel-forming protein [Mycolicibacterium conceptionense]MCW1820821.1 copper transporter [Mycolicibacterium senegalense]OBB14210.1 channel-forming protein [Mycolicibacterium conceptionense]
MITLRAHAISLAAVFLALAIGVALGSGLLSNTVLSGLRDDKKDLQHQIETLTDGKNALNEKLNAAGEFDAQLAPRMVRDTLKDKSVVLFRTPDAADGDVEAVSRFIRDAGGTVTGKVSLTSEFVEANSADKLLSVVNSPIVPAGKQLSTAAVDQGSQAGDLLGITLLIDRNPAAAPVDDTQRQTVLAALRDTGFLTYDDPHIGAANTALIITGGGFGADGGNRGATVARFAAGLAPHGTGTVLAGRSGSASGTGPVAVTRSDAGLNAVVSTVDDADSSAGQITAVLALGDLVGGGKPGKYGTGQGATSVTVPQ